MRGDNSIALVRLWKFRAGKQERSPEGKPRGVRGPDNRALARKTPGLRSNGCKQSDLVCNQYQSRTCSTNLGAYRYVAPQFHRSNSDN
jgi:hypothetical protein